MDIILTKIHNIMGRTQGTFGKSSPRGKSFGEGNKITINTQSSTSKKASSTKKK